MKNAKTKPIQHNFVFPSVTSPFILGPRFKQVSEIGSLTLYLIEMPFKAFANRADPDQAALVRAALSGFSLFAFEILYI